MVRVGMILLAVGTGVVTGYIIYLLVRYVFLDPDFPLPLKIGVPVAVAGLLILIAIALWQRVRSRGKKYLEEAEP